MPLPPLAPTTATDATSSAASRRGRRSDLPTSSRTGRKDAAAGRSPHCLTMTYVPAPDRYDAMPYRRCGRSGLQLPALSLGLWNNFGDDRPVELSRSILRRAFDLGITHFDLA